MRNDYYDSGQQEILAINRLANNPRRGDMAILGLALNNTFEVQEHLITKSNNNC